MVSSNASRLYCSIWSEVMCISERQSAAKGLLLRRRIVVKRVDGGLRARLALCRCLHEANDWLVLLAARTALCVFTRFFWSWRKAEVQTREKKVIWEGG